MSPLCSAPVRALSKGISAQHNRYVAATVAASLEVRRSSLDVFPPSRLPRPKPGKAHGTACIVAPGGSYRSLVIGMEAVEPARWLADLGVAAFALEYRNGEKYTGVPDVIVGVSGDWDWAQCPSPGALRIESCTSRALHAHRASAGLRVAA